MYTVLVLGAEKRNGNDSAESGKKLLGLTVPDDVPINGLAAFAAILGAVAAVSVYEYKKHKKNKSNSPGTEPPKAKKNYRRQ